MVIDTKSPEKYYRQVINEYIDGACMLSIENQIDYNSQMIGKYREAPMRA